MKTQTSPEIKPSSEAPHNSLHRLMWNALILSRPLSGANRIVREEPYFLDLESVRLGVYYISTNIIACSG
jgi:hypothetical protein